MSAFTGIFGDVPLLPPNIVLGLNKDCMDDPHPEKINLTIGAYRSESGEPVVLNCVRKAEEIIFNQRMDNGEYKYNFYIQT